uniref:Josephin-like protein n=1 Tax=Nelumbo nucifera TaxID=4432 RepID=A0A822Z9A8_NELNU|nr:TPA_asm: hypothetical protein HUJ06_015493 [Nelumbo nucifera]
MEEKRRMVKSSVCMPRFSSRRSNNKSSSKRPLSPISLLERFRGAVLRLIMLSSLSNKSTQQSAPAAASAPRAHYSHDPHHSEAVADCIEFIKRSATATGI